LRTPSRSEFREVSCNQRYRRSEWSTLRGAKRSCQSSNSLHWGYFLTLFFALPGLTRRSARVRSTYIPAVESRRTIDRTAFCRDLLRPSRSPTCCSVGIGVVILTAREDMLICYCFLEPVLQCLARSNGALPTILAFGQYNVAHGAKSNERSTPKLHLRRCGHETETAHSPQMIPAHLHRPQELRLLSFAS
jgi:hypothetical protein